METVAISKGQISIPPKIRHELGIKEGTHIRIEVDISKNKIILIPITRQYIHSLRGQYRGKGLMKALISEKRWKSVSRKKYEQATGYPNTIERSLHK